MTPGSSGRPLSATPGSAGRRHRRLNLRRGEVRASAPVRPSAGLPGTGTGRRAVRAAGSDRGQHHRGVLPSSAIPRRRAVPVAVGPRGAGRHRPRRPVDPGRYPAPVQRGAGPAGGADRQSLAAAAGGRDFRAAAAGVVAAGQRGRARAEQRLGGRLPVRRCAQPRQTAPGIRRQLRDRAAAAGLGGRGVAAK